MRRLSPMRRSADDLSGALRDTSLRVRAAEIDVLRAAAVAVITILAVLFFALPYARSIRRRAQ